MGQAVSTDQALQDMAPIIKREAGKLHRKLPASVTLDEVEQAARIAAWQALQDFDGRGNVQAFATQRIQQRLIDFQRAEHPAGRNGAKPVPVSDDEAAAMVPGDDDPAASVELAQQFESQMRKFAPGARAAIERAIAGKSSPGVSAAKVSAMLEGKRDKTPASFDPDSVPVLMGLQVPSIQRKRVNRFAKLLNRLPSGGAYRLGRVQAESLASEAKKQGVRYALRADPQSETLMLFFREPSPEQLKGK